MIILKAKYFNRRLRDWAYIEENGVPIVFDSRPELERGVARHQPQAYTADEWQAVPFIVCGCGKELEMQDNKKAYRCTDCGRVYDAWGKLRITYAEPPGYYGRCI